MAAYLPPGWPSGVHPPDSEEFEQTAVTWLLDVVPPDYRLPGVLRRHPVALAVLARHHIAACVRGAREGYRSARTELGGKLPPGGVDAVLEVYRTEGSRLVDTARAVDLVGRALRGEVFTPQLGGTQDERRGAPGERSPKSERDVQSEGNSKSERGPKSERGARSEGNGKTERGLKGERGAKSRRGASPGRPG